MALSNRLAKVEEEHKRTHRGDKIIRTAREWLTAFERLPADFAEREPDFPLALDLLRHEVSHDPIELVFPGGFTWIAEMLRRAHDGKAAVTLEEYRVLCSWWTYHKAYCQTAEGGIDRGGDYPISSVANVDTAIQKGPYSWHATPLVEGLRTLRKYHGDTEIFQRIIKSHRGGAKWITEPPRLPPLPFVTHSHEEHL